MELLRLNSLCIEIHYQVYYFVGTTDALDSSSEYMEIPVKAFEMLHLQTYQSDFISAYCKSATVVDTQLALAQLAQREVSTACLYLLFI